MDDNVRSAVAKLKEAMDMFSRGPLDFYLTELIAAHDFLMDRFAQLKVGDRVSLTKVPNYETAPSWRHCRHFLVPGARGTVVEAGCGSRGFRFSVVFDDESWIDNIGSERPKGTIVPIAEDRKHQFVFGEGYLERIKQPKT